MKATLEGTYAGSGGKQHIKIVGNLTAEGLGESTTVDLSTVESKIKNLEDAVVALQAQVQNLQAQNLQTAVKELAAALETLRAEQTTPEATSTTTTDATAVVDSIPVATPTTSKKK